MARMIARCGFKCRLCVAFSKNIAGRDDQVRAAAAWLKYFGLDVAPEKIKCNGCLSKECSNLEFPEKNCPIRPCAVKKGKENCASCEDYICDKLGARMIGFEEIAKRFKRKISREEYIQFIAPYDSRKTLDRIRKNSGAKRKKKSLRKERGKPCPS
jgi:hypothetical protein